MGFNIDAYIETYLKWLREKISFQKIGDYYEITTPFFDPCNDAIQIYIKKESDHFVFSDDGYTLNTLIAQGFSLSGNRKEQLEKILLQYNAKLIDCEIVSQCPLGCFPDAKHMFIQALLRVNDLYLTVRTRKSSTFTEDVALYLRQNEMFCTPNVQLAGKSGFNHNYDFLFQQTKQHPMRLCSTMNQPVKHQMANLLFSWEDTRKARSEDSQFIVILNDENKIQSGITEGLTNYNVIPVLWSKVDEPQNRSLFIA
ncbi:MAG: DUF1829 domain-containing protein [Oribacterium sp.]